MALLHQVILRVGVVAPDDLDPEELRGAIDGATLAPIIDVTFGDVSVNDVEVLDVIDTRISA